MAKEVSLSFVPELHLSWQRSSEDLECVHPALRRILKLRQQLLPVQIQHKPKTQREKHQKCNVCPKKLASLCVLTCLYGVIIFFDLLAF